MPPDPPPPPAAEVASGASRAPLGWLLVATWFGSGLSPKAPGTAGSLASMVLWAPLILVGAPWWLVLAIAVALFVLGTYAANAIVRAEGREDPQKVVIDEVVGVGITLLGAPPTWWALVLAFGLFRVFDIWKPWPVRLADRAVKGGFGVMLDDVVAALYALAGMQVVVRWLVPQLLGGDV